MAFVSKLMILNRCSILPGSQACQRMWLGTFSTEGDGSVGHAGPQQYTVVASSRSSAWRRPEACRKPMPWA